MSILQYARKGSNIKVSTIDDDLFVDTNSTQANEFMAYNSVSYCYRAIDMRAKGVSTLPYEWNNPDHLVAQALDKVLPNLLWLIEASLSIYGAAYLLNNANKYNIVKPRWLLPTTIQPRYEPHIGLVGFDRASLYNGKSSYERLSLEEITYFWYPNMFSEMGYGASPTRVALHEANVLIGLDEFSAKYLQRGAIKAVLLQAGTNDPLQGTPPKEELDRLRIWWRNLVQGVRSAWNSVVVTTQVNPVVIGDGLHELDETKVVDTRIKSICVAYGVPLSLMLPEAANYATAQIDYLNLYKQTIVPEAQLICNLLNAQLLAPYGLTITPAPERTDVFAYSETERANGLAALVERGILTLSEARERLGLPELEDTSPPIEFTEALINSGAFGINDIRASYGLEPVDSTKEEKYRDLNQTFSLFRAAKDAGLSTEVAAQMIGVTLPTTETTTPVIEAQGVPDNNVEPDTEALNELYKSVEQMYLNSLRIDSTLLSELQNLGSIDNELQEHEPTNGTTDDKAIQRYP